MNVRKLFGLGLLVILPLNGVPSGLLWGQEAATGGAGALADLKQHPERWPAQLTLKSEVRLTITSQSREVGAIVSPAGATVTLVSVDDPTLQIGVGAARASVTPDQTDLWTRVAPSTQAVPATVTNIPAAAPPVPTPPPPLVHVVSTPPPSPAAPSVPASAVTGPPIVLNVDDPPKTNYSKAAFRFWSPSYTQPIRGVIVLVPGLSGDGRGQTTDVAWQALAQKYRLALVGCFLQGGSYYEAQRGTGDALLDALKQFGEQSKHPELERAPLLLWGESAGGQFDYDFALWKPERVMAFVVNKGGYYTRDEPDSRMRAVPGLFFLGQKDSDLRIQAITAIWTNGRREGALWALTPQQNSGHEFSKTPALGRIFFEAVLKARLPDDNGSSDEAPAMKPMEEDKGWLGDLTTHEVHDASTDAQPDRKASWLPDASSAQAWKAFVSSPN